MIKVLIYWHEYPVCATRIDSLDESRYEVKVYSTRPKVPFNDFAKNKFPPIYVDNSTLTASYIISNNPQPDILLITGWAHKVWLEIARYYKLKGTKVVMMVDNNLRFTIKQIFGSLIFRLLYSDIADYYMVPGSSASKLLQFFGVESSKIFRGYYGFSSSWFQAADRTGSHFRNKNFVFVGQKNNRKGIDVLCKSYERYRVKGGTWGLIIIGSGSSLQKRTGIKEYEFMQPSEIAQIYNVNIAFILPSRVDHWGTVVVEAASCGMIPIVSTGVGAADDIVFNGINGFIFDKCNVESLANIMIVVSKLDEKTLDVMRQRSIEIASMFNESTFAEALESMVTTLREVGIRRPDCLD